MAATVDYSQLSIAYIHAPILKSTGEKSVYSCGP
jgi:hypothetical protein